MVCVGRDTGRLGRARGQGPLWLHPRGVPVGPARVSTVAPVFPVVGWGLGAAAGGCPSPCPIPPLSHWNPTWREAEAQPEMFQQKKRHNGSQQTFLARTFPAGLQAYPRSILSSPGFRPTHPALLGSPESPLLHHVTAIAFSPHPSDFPPCRSFPSGPGLPRTE